MADLKISALNSLAGADLVAADVVAVVDDSASETKKLTVNDLIANGVTIISDATIPSAKILFSAGAIDTAELAASAVEAAKIRDSAVTAAKLADNSSVTLVSTLPASGAFTGQIALDTDDNKIYVWDGSAWDSVKGAGSINVVNGSTTGEVNIVASTSGDTVTISATLDNTTAAAQFLGGPTGAAGAVGYRALVGSDLPTATTTTKGGVIVNGEGLRMDLDTIEIANDVTANSSTYQAVQFNSKGLITAGRDITAADLPEATAGAIGGVKPGSGLTMGSAGAINHSNAVTGATNTKITFDAQGHVTAGTNLSASDIPDLDTAKVTTGEFPTERIADEAVTADKLANYTVAQISETTPTADFTSQFFFNPITRDLFLWDGNVFQPVGISAGEIVLAGTYDASTNLLDSVTADGSAAGFTNGASLPAADTGNNRYYVVVSQSGTGSAPAPTVALEPPDIILSNGTSYVLIETSETITAQIASNVGFTPTGNIAGTNVQAALSEVDSEKVAKAGDTMTGDLTLNNADVVFEGATENDYETTLTVTDPTADRTITLPDVTGTVVTTGDTGSVTSAMITNGTIVNADISASAEIAVSKLANGTARQLLQTDAAGTGVEFTSNVDVPGTFDVAGAGTFDTTLTVTGVISADGKIKFPAGTAAAPSFYSGTDTDTGLYFSAADEVSVATGGTQRVVVDASGNVGFGAAAPTNYKTYIKQAGTWGLVLEAVSDDSRLLVGDINSEFRFSASYAGTGSYRPLTFFTSDLERLRIDSSGRLLVNGTSASGDNKLQVIDSDASIYGVTVGRGSGAVSGNTAVGSSALLFNTTGNQNTATGTQALRSNTTANYNTANGYIALYSNTTGDYNTATGNRALYSNTEGYSNVANGYGALFAVTTGNQNIAIGAGAGDAITTGSNNTIIGDIPGTAALADTVIIAAGSTERMRIDSSGNVRIGSRAYQTSFLTPSSANLQIDGGLIFDPGSGNDAEIYNYRGTALKLGTAGAEKLRIDSAGNVGIGTSSPAITLDVHGADTSANGLGDVKGQLRIFNDTTAFGSSPRAGIVFSTKYRTSPDVPLDGAAIYGGKETTGDANKQFFLAFATRDESPNEAVERMRINSGGNVGINTTSPTAQVDIASTTTYGLRINHATLPLQSFTVNGTQAFSIGANSGGGGSFYYGAGNVEAARIDTAGRLLVGTSSARGNFNNQNIFARLQVEGTANNNSAISVVQNFNGATLGARLILGKSNGSTVGSNTIVPVNNTVGAVSFQGNDGTEFVEAAEIKAQVDGTPGANDMPGRLVFSTTADGASSPTERMRISSSGAPSFYSSATGVWSALSAAAGTTFKALVVSHSASGVASGTESLRIFSNGDVQNTNNSYTAISDVTLKENIVPASEQWDNIKGIEVVNYNFKEETGHETHKQLGVIAQQVEEISPGLVNTDEDGLKSVNYSVLYMKSVKALQEAMDRIETLEAKVAALEAG